MSSSPSPPPAPDPVATANAQSTSNVNTAAANSALNNINSYTPYGSTTYQQTGTYTTPNGEVVPTYSQETQLSPLAQQILTGNQGITAGLLPSAQTLASSAGNSVNTPLNFNTPFSGAIAAGPGAIGATNPAYGGVLSNANALGNLDPSFASTLRSIPQNMGNLNPAYAPTLNAGPQLLDQNVTNAIYGQEKSFLDPQWGLQQTQLQDQLSRQGIPVGSEAYNNAMGQLSNARTQAYQSAQDSAIGQGAGAASNMFGMALQGQQADTARQAAQFGTALQGQQQLSAQQQAAVNAALQGQQLSTSQQQAAFDAALRGQQQDISQQTLGQSQPLSLLQQLFGAVPATPQQPLVSPAGATIAPTDVLGSQALSTNAANTQYQAQLAQSNANTGAAAGLAGAAVTAGAIAI